METKNFEPVFQMVANGIAELSVENTLINHYDTQDLNRDFSCGINDLSIETHDEYKSGGMHFFVNVAVGDKEDSQKSFNLKLVLFGIFKTSVDMTDKDFEGRIKVNGSAALYSIARGIIINISSQAFVEGKITLPLVNFVEFSKSEDTLNND